MRFTATRAKNGIVGLRQPIGKCGAPIANRRIVDLAVARQPGLHDLASARLPHFAVAGDVHDFFVQPSARLAVHAIEERGQAIEIVLRPILKRMVMALGTLNSRAKKKLRRRLRGLDRLVTSTVIIGRRVVVRAALRRQQFTGKLVERRVLCNHIDQPVVEFVYAGFGDFLLLKPQQIAPFQCPKSAHARADRAGCRSIAADDRRFGPREMHPAPRWSARCRSRRDTRDAQNRSSEHSAAGSY